MPSGVGSHGGGGGGHFGGGGGGHSGGHFGGGHSGGGGGAPFRPHGRPHIMHGRNVFIFGFGGRQYYREEKSANRLALLSFFFIFFLSIGLVVGISFWLTNSEVEYIKYDNQKYIAMINKAKEDDNYKIQGYVYDFEEYNGKWCIFYRFKDKDDNWLHYNDYSAYSFYVYTADEIEDMEETFIDLATSKTKDRINSATDTIEMTYADKTLDDDAEYVEKAMVLPFLKYGLIGVGVVEGIIVLSLILTSIKTAHKYVPGQDDKKDLNLDDVDSKKTLKSSSRKCKYCGSTLKEGQTKCDNCGGSVY